MRIHTKAYEQTNILNYIHTHRHMQIHTNAYKTYIHTHIPMCNYTMQILKMYASTHIYVYIYRKIYVYIYTHMYVCVCVCLHFCMYIQFFMRHSIHLHRYLCMCMFMHTDAECTYIHTYIPSYIHTGITFIHTYIRTDITYSIHIYIRTYLRTHVRTYTHIHNVHTYACTYIGILIYACVRFFVIPMVSGINFSCCYNVHIGIGINICMCSFIRHTYGEWN